MPNVLIRDVPVDVHRTLQRRAEERGQSLQQYLLEELRRLTERMTMDEWLARVATRRGGRGSLQEAVDYVRERRGPLDRR
jgi:hypothetical protein